VWAGTPADTAIPESHRPARLAHLATAARRRRGAARIRPFVATDRPEESSGPADSSRSGPWRGIVQGFFHRRQEAWQRVHELEERAGAAPFAVPDFKRVNELLKASDAAGLRRLNEQWEQTRKQREGAVAEAPWARRRVMLRFELPFAVIGLVILLAIAALNYLWLRALGVDYVDSYLRDGFQVALLFTVVGYAISLDSRPGLIAPHPAIYVAAIFELFTGLLASLAALFGNPRSDRALADAGLEILGRRFRPRTFDLAVSWMFMLSFGSAMLAWAVLIAPLQYWVNLVCGAPAREALASSKTLWLAQSAHRNEFLLAPKDPNEIQQRELEKARKEGKLTEIGFAAKPVSFTSGIATAVLFGISQLV
jgi:hypothetical protein